MNEEMAAPDLLRAAARLIERAAIKLDVGEVACASCHVKHYNNLTQAKAYLQITDQPDKLRRLADTLEGRDTPQEVGLRQRVESAGRRQRRS